MAVTFVLVRIDDRLIHGQVVQGWAKSTKTEHIIVANDEKADDPIEVSLLELATPPQLGLSICPIHELVGLCKQDALDGKKVLVLFRSAEDVWRAIESGFEIEHLNVGGIRHGDNKNKVMDAVYLDEKDILYFRKIKEANTQIEVKMVPTDKPVTLDRYLSC